MLRVESTVCFQRKLSRMEISHEDSAPLLLAVARVLGDFSPRKFPSFVALAVRGFAVCFVLKECCFLSPLLLLVEKSPKLCVLTINNLVLSQRFFDFSSSLGESAACGSDVRRAQCKKSQISTTRIFVPLKQFLSHTRKFTHRCFVMW